MLVSMTMKNWCVSVASNKGEAEPERKETRNKVDEDRKHEYPCLLSDACSELIWGTCIGATLPRLTGGSRCSDA
jgi:hypothetical protein